MEKHRQKQQVMVFFSSIKSCILPKMKFNVFKDKKLLDIPFEFKFLIKIRKKITKKLLIIVISENNFKIFNTDTHS